MSQSSTAELVRWDVPFAETFPLNLNILVEDNGESVQIVVEPEGFSKYPKYLVRFRHAVTLLYYEEMHAIVRGFENLSRSEDKLFAYKWITSPWLQNYRVLEDFLFSRSQEKLHHYLIFGCDTIVEVIALGELSIETITSRRFIETRMEV